MELKVLEVMGKAKCRSNITMAYLSEYPKRRERILKELKGSQHAGGGLQELRSGHFMRLDIIVTATGRH